MMEYVDGCNLKKIIRTEGIQSVEFTKLCAHHVGNALAHLHENNIIHRDVKPENVLVRNTEKYIPILESSMPAYLLAADMHSTAPKCLPRSAKKVVGNTIVSGYGTVKILIRKEIADKLWHYLGYPWARSSQVYMALHPSVAECSAC